MQLHPMSPIGVPYTIKWRWLSGIDHRQGRIVVLAWSTIIKTSSIVALRCLACITTITWWFLTFLV
jgi:hypothetical protein